jgi:hypothetical protein
MFINQSNLAIQCRRRLFHEQIGRFRRCEYRRPTWNELRSIWQSTGFKTL